jgi:hypothetical protein
MGSLSDSLQIKGFYRTQSIATASGKITISSTRIKTILVMTEKEIRKGPGNQSAGQILEMHKREAGAEPSQYHRKTFRRYTQFYGGFGGEEEFS